MNLNKKYEEFKQFPLLVKLSFVPAIVLGIGLIACIVWLSINNPLYLASQVLTVLFTLSILKLLFFYMMDYPKLKQKMEQERLEKLKLFE